MVKPLYLLMDAILESILLIHTHYADDVFWGHGYIAQIRGQRVKAIFAL